MTDRIAIVLVAILVAAILADTVMNDGQGLLFLLRKLRDLVEYVTIWR